MKKIPFDQCPYVRDAEGHAREWLYVNGCYYCAYELKLNPEEAWGCGIRFEYSTCEFWEFCPLLERMLEVLDFYKTEPAQTPVRSGGTQTPIRSGSDSSRTGTEGGFA